MKKKLLSHSCLIFTLLFTCIFLGNSNDNVSAATAYTQLDLPVVTIETTNNGKITSNETYVDAQINIIDEKYTMNNMPVSIRLRGNSTLNVAKSSFKLKFDKKQNLLNIGKGEGKTWGLIANYYDASLLRNLTAYHMASMLTFSPYEVSCRSVDVYLNGSYEGTYLLTELINVNKNRINIAESLDAVEENGYLLQMTGYAEDYPFTVGTRKYEIKNDLSENQSTQNAQKQYISNYIALSMKALQQNSQEAAAQYIDINSLVDNYIGNELVKNCDVGWDSFYLYKDAGGKLVFGPMWDFDLAFGNSTFATGISSYKGFSINTVINSETHSNPWFTTALSCKWFRVLVQKRWNQLESQFKQLPNFVTTEAQKNYNSYNRNFDKWGRNRMTFFEPSEIARLTTFTEHYTYLSSWISNRITWLSSYYNTTDFIRGIMIDENGKALTTANDTADIPNSPTPTATAAPTTSPTTPPNPTTSPTTTSTPIPSSNSGISVKLEVVNEWQSGAICNIIVTNQSGKDLTNGWTVEFDFNRSIDSLWSGKLVSSTNGHYVITNPDWEKTLANGKSYTFSCQVGDGNGYNLSNVTVK